MFTLEQLKKEILKNANSQKAKFLAGFFKTGKGQYAQGDIFLGITVLIQRQIAKKYQNLSLSEIQELLASKYHEFRLCALLILVSVYKKADKVNRQKIVNFYLKNTKSINNWDLVDLSAHYILGDFLEDKDKSVLYKLAKSQNLWERRIAIIATFFFIRKDQFTDTFKIAQILLGDKHDLIHKACGWMLREVGKRDEVMLIKFLDKFKGKMPRTALRYAIERFNQQKRLYYLREYQTHPKSAI